MSQLDVAWLRVQARPPQPRVIVAINLNLRELQELLDEPQPWVDPWEPDTPHFASVAWGRDCHAAGQERLAAWPSPALFLSHWVQRYMECSSTA